MKTNTFGSENNKIYFFSKNKTEIWDKMPKQDVAKKIVSNVIDKFKIV